VLKIHKRSFSWYSSKLTDEYCDRPLSYAKHQSYKSETTPR